MPNPQTATERFLRHGVAGGWNTEGFSYGYGIDQKSYEEALLQPALWEAAGRSLGWDDIATNPKNVSWLEHQHRLIDHLAAHPGDVEGYLGMITGGSETQ